MHAHALLHRLFGAQLNRIHARRLRALFDMVQAALVSSSLSLTQLGRYLHGNSHTKHKIKRADRLLGNPHLSRDRMALYATVAQHTLRNVPEPLILIDWSDLRADQSLQWLRAVVPLGGRALVLYDEVHPRRLLANRLVQHRFLRRLATLLPLGARPIIVADAGFRSPFYREVERLGWHWVGRIRNRDCIAWHNAPYHWHCARSLYRQARKTPQCLGHAQWVRYAPLRTILYLMRARPKGRVHQTVFGTRSHSETSLRCAARSREPWLLAASLSLQSRSARCITGYYRQRMQIEQSFRDTKSARFGIGLEQARTLSVRRFEALLLVAALALFVLYLIGLAAQQRQQHRHLQANTIRRRRVYSIIFLARQIILHHSALITAPDLTLLNNTIRAYHLQLHHA
jgi:hypothetical protein